MSKLFKLKEWLTVADTARHLTIIFGEDVTEADVLRLSLDGHLRLSVYLVNHAKARPGNVVRYTETELSNAIASGNLPKDLSWLEVPAGAMSLLRRDLPPEEMEKPLTVLRSLKIGEDQYLTLGDELTTITGVWDIPMIGNERLDIEHEFQKLAKGPAVTVEGTDGTFVRDINGKIYQLQDDFEDNAELLGSKASLKLINDNFAHQKVGKKKKAAILEWCEQKRKAFVEKYSGRPKIDNYYPAAGLPPDSLLVVRIDALTEFTKTLEKRDEYEKPLSNTERKSLLTIIAALSKDAGLDYTRHAKTAGHIKRTLDAMGVAIGETTIEGHLKKIPDALETRMK